MHNYPEGLLWTPFRSCIPKLKSQRFCFQGLCIFNLGLPWTQFANTVWKNSMWIFPKSETGTEKLNVKIQVIMIHSKQAGCFCLCNQHISLCFYSFLLFIYYLFIMHTNSNLCLAFFTALQQLWACNHGSTQFLTAWVRSETALETIAGNRT